MKVFLPILALIAIACGLEWYRTNQRLQKNASEMTKTATDLALVRAAVATEKTAVEAVEQNRLQIEALKMEGAEQQQKLQSAVKELERLRTDTKSAKNQLSRLETSESEQSERDRAANLIFDREFRAAASALSATQAELTKTDVQLAAVRARVISTRTKLQRLLPSATPSTASPSPVAFPSR